MVNEHRKCRTYRADEAVTAELAAVPRRGRGVGTTVDFTGTDTLRVRDGLITDYRLNADTRHRVTAA